MIDNTRRSFKLATHGQSLSPNRLELREIDNARCSCRLATLGQSLSQNRPELIEKSAMWYLTGSRSREGERHEG